MGKPTKRNDIAQLYAGVTTRIFTAPRTWTFHVTLDAEEAQRRLSEAGFSGVVRKDNISRPNRRPLITTAVIVRRDIIKGEVHVR